MATEMLVNPTLNVLGVALVVSAAGLQQFYAYRKEQMSQRRTCNDSRATLLLYLSLGLSFELLALGITPLALYSVACEQYADFASLLFVLLFSLRLETRAANAWEWAAAGLYILALGYSLDSTVLVFPNVGEMPLDTDGFILLRPYLLLYSLLAGGVFLLFRRNSPSRFWIYRFRSPAAVGAVGVYCLKLLSAMFGESLEGKFIGPGSYLLLLVLVALSFAGRHFLVEKAAQSGDRVAARQTLGFAFYCAFFLLLLLPVQTSTVLLESPAASLNLAIVAQFLIMLVRRTQTAILFVTSRRRFLRTTQPAEKSARKGEPVFTPFDEELERETF